MNAGPIPRCMVDLVSADDDRMYQVSLLQALAAGDYHGLASMDELKEHGDTGIGTFDRLDGEMIMLDGSVFKASGDGSVQEVREDTSPFACVGRFRCDSSVRISADSFADMTAGLDRSIHDRRNMVHMLRIDAVFDSVEIRSVPGQSEPYEPLAKTLAEQQRVWTHRDICGTAIGVYCPSYLRTVNNSGWHLHFISDDRHIGGHILDLSLSDAECRLCRFGGLEIRLPDNDRFSSLDLSDDMRDDIRRIEGNQ